MELSVTTARGLRRPARARDRPRGAAHARAAESLAGTLEARVGRDAAAAGRGRDRRRDVPRRRASRRPGFDGGTLARARARRPRTSSQDAVSDNTLGHRPHPARVPGLRARVRAHRRALAAGRRSTACSTPRSSIGKGDFSVEVPTEGNDEFAALGQGVQLDGAPARGAPGGAAARARAAAGDRPARRRVARQGPGPRRAARHRRADRGRRRRRRVRARRDAPRRQRHAGGGRPRRRRRRPTWPRVQAAEAAALRGRRGGRDADLRAPTRSRARCRRPSRRTACSA